MPEKTAAVGALRKSAAGGEAERAASIHCQNAVVWANLQGNEGFGRQDALQNLRPAAKATKKLGFVCQDRL